MITRLDVDARSLEDQGSYSGLIARLLSNQHLRALRIPQNKINRSTRPVNLHTEVRREISRCLSTVIETRQAHYHTPKAWPGHSTSPQTALTPGARLVFCTPPPPPECNVGLYSTYCCSGPSYRYVGRVEYSTCGAAVKTAVDFDLETMSAT